MCKNPDRKVKRKHPLILSDQHLKKTLLVNGSIIVRQPTSPLAANQDGEISGAVNDVQKYCKCLMIVTFTTHQSHINFELKICYHFTQKNYKVSPNVNFGFRNFKYSIRQCAQYPNAPYSRLLFDVLGNSLFFKSLK